MKPETKRALMALGMAPVMGLLGNWLFWQDSLGLNGLIWVAALVGLLFWVGRKAEAAVDGEGRWLLAAAVLFAACLVWRASPTLKFLDFLALGLCLGLGAMTARGGSLRTAGLSSYLLGLVMSGVNHLFGPVNLLFTDVDWKELPRSRWQRTSAVLRGLLLALPLLFIFGLLFMAADALFEQMVVGLFRPRIPDLGGRLLLFIFFAWLAGGFMRTALVRQPEELPAVKRPEKLSVGAIEIGVVLGSLNLLFLAFVLVQVRYLFGGAGLVDGLTYAEYARRGFFELALVSALVLPVLLVGHWLVPPERPTEQRLFRWLGGSLIGLLFVIMTSALQRMLLYQAQFGLTELRLFTTAFMGWMAIVFVWFAATVLRGRRERFAFGALVSGLAVLVGLHVVNPDGLIARTNLARLEQGQQFDAYYLASLSSDAVPEIVAALPQLEGLGLEERQAVEDRLGFERSRLAKAGWLDWNLGAARAARSLRE